MTDSLEPPYTFDKLRKATKKAVIGEVTRQFHLFETSTTSGSDKAIHALNAQFLMQELTTHALERMRQRGILAADVEHALINGQVVLCEAKRDDMWRVEGRDVDGDPLTIEVVTWENTIKVVTAFRPK
jgi:hypothetical protein